MLRPRVKVTVVMAKDEDEPQCECQPHEETGPVVHHPLSDSVFALFSTSR